MEREVKAKGQKKQRDRRELLEMRAAGEGKMPPHSLELEEAVLGALMLEKEALTEVIEILHPETFYKEAHSKIFSAILSLFSRSEPVDLMTVTQELRQNGELEFVGGPFYVTQLTSKVDSAANIVYHARILVQFAIKRDLIGVSGEISRDAFEDTTDVFDLLDRMESTLFEISEKNIRKNYEGIDTLMLAAINELEAARNHQDSLTGVPSGFTQLDRLTSGWQRSDLVIMAARPGMGKTAFVVSAMRNAAVDFKRPVAIFSLEMSSVQLVKRMISAEAELESEKLRKGNLTDQEWDRMINSTARVSQAPIFIDDTPALSVMELRAKARRLKAQHDIQLIIIDYLQLMTAGDASKSGGNREQEISYISRSLKQIAKELDVPVISLSQLSRAVETRGGDKRPQLSDLRESGAIEQDADMVIFLYRPEYYGITEDEEGNPVEGLGEVIIAKHRNGSLDTVPLRFIGKYTRFTDWGENGFGTDDPFRSFEDTYMDSNLPDQANKPAEKITLGSKMNQADEETPPGDAPF